MYYLEDDNKFLESGDTRVDFANILQLQDSLLLLDRS